MPKQAIVIGAGIVGLAVTRALAVRGYAVTVVERGLRVTGASIRNFGMVWPIGQPEGALYERALLSRSIWETVCREAGIWHDPVGSLHVAYTPTEWTVLQELQAQMAHRGCGLLSPVQVKSRSQAVVEEGLLGGLYSPHELIVDPRKAIAGLPDWLTEQYGVRFLWNTTVTDVVHPSVFAGDQMLEADEIYVCSGADFETLYPALYASQPLTKCKLQMMRLAPQPGNWRMGPALCGGLSLLHYNSFKVAASLPQLQQELSQEWGHYLEHGIHVMVSQNSEGALTVGDSHEYGLVHDPFDRQQINQWILDYLKRFARFADETVTETWHGIYPKMTNGEAHIVLEPEAGVMIINGLGGAGMTLSFGLCEELVQMR